MVVELYDSRVVPIVYLQNIKSDMEYIRSTDNKLMDATDDASKKPIQEDIQTHIASMEEKLAKYKNASDYKEILESFDKFVAANDLFIKSNGVGAIKVQSSIAGPPTNIISASSEDLRIATKTTAASLDTISSTIEEIASSATDTAAITQETSAHTTEAVNLTESTSIATKNTANNSKKAKEAAQEGAAKITEVVSSITDIASSSVEVSLVINELDDSSKGLDILLGLYQEYQHKQISDLIKENQLKTASAVNIEAARSFGLSDMQIKYKTYVRIASLFLEMIIYIK